MRSNIDPGEPFLITIECLEDDTEFKVFGDREYLAYSHKFKLEHTELKDLVISGPVQIHYVGFSPPGTEQIQCLPVCSFY